MSARSTGPGRWLWRALTWPIRVLVEPQSTPTIMVIVVLSALGAGYWLVRTATMTTTAAGSSPSAGAPLWQPRPTPIATRVSSGDPFADTAAAALAVGEAGIIMPPASALPGASE